MCVFDIEDGRRMEDLFKREKKESVFDNIIVRPLALFVHPDGTKNTFVIYLPDLC
jgi:hypothetical protein